MTTRPANNPPTQIQSRHPFERSGLASLSDCRTLEWRSLFDQLAQDQAAFLKEEARFRSPEYCWPRDPLRTWSRAWEYPYVYYQLQQWKRTHVSDEQTIVADVGSGVTFFPFSIAKLGIDVFCTDSDPVCEKDIRRARECVACDPGSVSFRASSGTRLPFEQHEVGCVFCISVLEHISQPEQTVSEIARILRPGGLFVVTIDLDLRGDSEIGASKRQSLQDTLRCCFDYFKTDRTIHPADALTTIVGPYPYRVLVGVERARFLLKQGVKRFLGLPARKLLPYFLAVEGMTLVRKG